MSDGSDGSDGMDYIMKIDPAILTSVMCLGNLNMTHASDEELGAFLMGFSSALTVLRLSPEYVQGLTYALPSLPDSGAHVYETWMRAFPIEVAR